MESFKSNEITAIIYVYVTFDKMNDSCTFESKMSKESETYTDLRDTNYQLKVDIFQNWNLQPARGV